MLIYLIILINYCFLQQTYQQSLQLYQQQNRIECKSEPERDTTYYVLNCTLINNKFDSIPSDNLQQQQQQQQQLQQSQYISQTSIDIVSTTDGFKVGLTSNWKTPWEEIQLNYDIIKTFIWKSSRISYIGEYTFKDLTMLEIIDLSSNRIYEINANAFKNFEVDLHELDLSSNLFETIPTYLFNIKILQSLEVFKFNDNKIYKLTNRTFEYLPKLKHLELNNCFIKDIDTNAFFNLKSLEYLSLNGNHLKTLNEQIFKDLNLRYLYLNDNLFTCDCNLRWLLIYLKTLEMYRHNIILASTVSLKCAEPNSLKSKHNFLDINPDSFMCDVQLYGYPEFNKTDLMYDYGDEIILKCEIYADPEPLIYWMYGNKRLEMTLNSDLKYQINEQYKFKSLKTNKTSELHIKNLQFNDIGTYTCIGEISGTTNRKQIQFNLKNLLKQTNFNNIFHNKYLTNLTLLILLISIAIIIFIFTLILIVYICVKCKRLKRRNEEESEENNENLVNNLFSNDEFDSKLPNCIRYAQKSNLNNNNNNNNNNANNTLQTNSDDKYTITEALLNNSSSTIVQPLTSHIYQHSNNPSIHQHQQQQRLQLLMDQQHQPHSQMIESACYYDDLRVPYDEVLFIPIDDQNKIQYQRQHQQQQQGGIDYHDANSMLYGTIMHQQQQQQQQQKLLTPIYGTLSNKYGQNNGTIAYYSQIPLQNQQSMTLLSSSSSSTAARYNRNPNTNFNPQQQIPPLKPKRTFEYSQPLIENNQQQQQITQQNHQPEIECINNSSTTLDEEDLDLNDLKDFEDVTFDNLRKPPEKFNNNNNHNNHKAKIIIDSNSKLVNNLIENNINNSNNNNSNNKLLIPKLIETHNLTIDNNKLYEETEI